MVRRAFRSISGRRTLGLRHKVLFATVGVLFICSTAVCYLTYETSRETVIKSFEKRCGELAQQLSRSATAWVGDGRADKLEVPLLTTMGGEQVVYVAIMGSEGEVLIDRGHAGVTRPRVPANDSSIRRLTYGEDEIFLADRRIFVAVDEEDARDKDSKRIEDEHGWRSAGWARVGLSTRNAESRFQALLIRNVRIMVAVLFAGGLLAYILMRAFLRPIEDLIAGSQAIAHGDFDYRVPLTAQDELGQLGASFNQMSQELKESKEELSNQNRTLEERVVQRTEELNRALEELTLLDRMKDEFLSSVSHEFRTPLTSIRSFTEILLEIGPDDEKTKNEFLTIIKTESERLTRLVNNVLDLVKIEAGEIAYRIVDVDVSAIVESTVSRLFPLLSGAGLRVRVDVEEGLPRLRADNDKLVQVLQNLIGNAIKFSPRGGFVEISAVRRGERVRLEVRDQGPGVPKEFLEQIFDRFRQIGDALHDKPKGTGLGLSICRTIVEGHGGKIWAEQRKGRGLKVCFELPIDVEATSANSDQWSAVSLKAR